MKQAFKLKTKTSQTLVSGSLVDAVKNWVFSNEHSFAGHRFIESTLLYPLLVE